MIMQGPSQHVDYRLKKPIIMCQGLSQKKDIHTGSTNQQIMVKYLIVLWWPNVLNRWLILDSPPLIGTCLPAKKKEKTKVLLRKLKKVYTH